MSILNEVVKREYVPVAEWYEGASFDGMIDLKSSKESLLCDAQGNLRNVRWGSDYVFTDREYDENQYAPSEVAKAVEAAIIARYAEGFAPEPHMLRTHEPMEHADWKDGETVASFAARCAESYFSRDFLK